MEKYVLDTNLFFNMEPGLGMGKKTEEVVVAVTQAMKRLKKEERHEFFAPPKVIDEFLSFFEDKEQPFIKDFLSTITVKSPDLHSVSLSAALVGQMIDEVRSRNYRGQTIAEEEIKQAAQTLAGIPNLGKKEFEMKIGPIVKHFRLRYRQATRFGFIDSLADFELIALAKELNGFLVSSDEGVIRWARLFGVKEISAPLFGKKMIGS
ncbi:MAG: RNA ligase partner protein [Candidatus Roizmanbacteria bacterium]|nr:MAG: RNA ligase partner protein [Candidatus Roizmanbacteria bacterium]